MTAGQDGHTGAYGGGTIENEVCQRAARVRRDDEVILRQRERLERTLLEYDTSRQARPRVGEHRVQLAARRRQRRIDADGLRRRVVQKQQHVGEEAMPGGQIDDAAAAEETADATRDLPGFVELFAREAAGGADDASDTIEQCAAREPPRIACGETSLR